MGSILPQLAAKYSVAAAPEGVIYDTAPGLGDRRSLITPSQQPGRSFKPDGSNDRVVIGNKALLNWGSGSGWCGGWFKGSVKPASFSTLLMNGSGSTGTTRRYAIQFNASGHLIGSIDAHDAGDRTIVFASDVLTGEWNHVVLVRDNASNLLRLYFNAVQVGTIDIAGYGSIDDTVYSRGLVLFATSDGTGVGNQQYFNGQAKDIRIGVPGEVLTAYEISEWYLKGPLGLSEKNVAIRIDGDDGDPSLAIDCSGNGYHGAKVGIDPAVGQFHYEGSDVPFSSENERGFSRYTRFTKATNSYVRLDPVGPITLANNRTIEMEVFLTEASNLWGTRQNTPVQGAALRVEAGGVLRYYHTGDAAGVATAAGAVLFNQWQNIKVTVQDWTVTFEVNGVAKPVSTGAMTEGAEVDSVNVPAIGHMVGATSEEAEGMIRNVRYTENGTLYTFAGDGVDGWDGCTLSNVLTVNIPAATDSIDAFGGSLSYQGKSPMDAVAKQGWAFNFDGSDDVITLPNFVNTSLLSQGRASIRFETTYGGVISENRRLFEFGNSNKRVGVFMGAGKLNLFATNGAGSNWRWIVTADTFNDGSYHLVEVAWGDEYWIKVDGRAVAVTQTTSGTPPGSSVPLDNNDPLLIADHVAAGAFNFNGRLCDFRAYDNTGKLYAHLPIAEGEGSAVAFDVVSGKAGYFTGASVGIGGTGWVRQDVYHHNLSSGFDSALVLNGVDGYLDTGLSLYYWPEFTVWQRSMFLSTNGYDLDGFWVSAHRVRLGRFSNSTGWFANFASSVDRSAAGNWLPNFSWRGLAMAGGKGIGTQLYINNTVAYSSSDWVVDIGTTKTYFIGASNDSGDVPLHFANKLCAEYRIYQRKLTAEEIRWLNSNGVEGDDPGTEGLKRHYDFTRGHMYDLSPENAGAATAYGGVSFVRVPSSGVLNNDGSDPIQPYKSNLPGVHNGAEQELDLTGGVAAPLSNARVNSSTNELVTYQSSLVATGEMQDEFGRTLPTKSFIESVANDYHQATTGGSGLYSFVAGKYYTLTVYARALPANPNKRYLILIPAATRNAFAANQMGAATFDLETGETFRDLTGHCVWADAKDIGGGYWRLSCAVKVVITQQAANTVRFSPVLNTGADTDPETIYAGDGQSGFELSEVMLYDGLYYPGPLMPLYLTNQSPPTAFRIPESLDNPMFTRTVTKDGRVHAVDQIVRFRVPLMGAQLQTAIEFYRDPKNTRLDNFKRPNREVVGDHWIQASERSKVTTGKMGSSAVVNQVVSLHKLPIPTVNPMVEVEVSGWNGEAAGCVMFSNQNASSYYAFIARDSATDTYGVYRWTGARLLPVGPMVSTAAPAEPFLMRAEIRYGVMRGYINDRLVIERDVSDPDLSGDSYVGVYYE